MSDDLDQARRRLQNAIPGPQPLRFPDDWQNSGSWVRAQEEPEYGAPIGPARFRVLLGNGNPHRVVFAILSGRVVVDCDCKAYQYNDGWCAHVARLWWDWCRGKRLVVDLDTGRHHPHPPSWLSLDDHSQPQHKCAAATDGGVPR